MKIDSCTEAVCFFDSTETPTFANPSRDQMSSTICALKSLDIEKATRIRFTEVKREDLPNFLSHLFFVDAYLRLSPEITMTHGTSEDYGSGVAEDVLAASCHATCEALERLLPRLGGMKHARPNANSAFSLRNKRFVELNFDPLSSDPKNPFAIPSGQAVHPISSEALRNAFGELIERHLVATTAGNNSWFDITESVCAANAQATKAKEYWRAKQYDFQIAATKSTFGLFFVVASAVHTDTGHFPASFRGTASDFDLSYAPLQALSELNRGACFGPYTAVENAIAAQLAQNQLSKHGYYFGYLDRMITTDWLALLPKGDIRKANLDSLRRTGTTSPRAAAKVLFDSYEDVLIVPYCEAKKLPVYGYKVCVPGLSQRAMERTRL